MVEVRVGFEQTSDTHSEARLVVHMAKCAVGLVRRRIFSPYEESGDSY